MATATSAAKGRQQHQAQGPQTQLRGTLRRIFNERSGWFTGKLEGEDGRVSTIAGVAGTIPGINSELVLTGEWTNHKVYGPQFKFTRCEATLPATREGVVRFLTTLDGVGPKRAEQIFDALGPACVRRIAEDPSCLASIPGMAKFAESAGANIQSRIGRIEVEQKLCSYGFGPRTQAKCWEKFGDRLGWILRHEPYRLVQLDRVSFRQIDDAVMANRDLPPEDPYRAAAAVVQVLKDAGDEGHTWLADDQIPDWIGKLKTAVAVPRDAVARGIEQAVADSLVRRIADAGGACGYAIPAIADDEDLSARRIATLLSRATPHGDLSKVPPAMLASLAPEQLAAVENAIRYPVSILTGGPGTGKTWATKAIIAALGGGDDLIVLAPTGKAAQRAKAVTGHRAQTIHMFCVAAEQAGPGAKLPRIVILDESSMISVDILAMLFRALPSDDLRIVFVGDVDQLPSVSAGRVLADLIDSKRIPTTRLTKVQRQAESSRIVANAHAINQGKAPRHDAADDWFFASAPNVQPEEDETPSAAEARVLAGRVIALVSRAVERWGYDVRRDIQILSGQRKGLLGTQALNEAMRAEFNPPDGSPAVRAGSTDFRAGDKVVVTENNYSLGVVNGDVGTVVAADPEHAAEDGKKAPLVVVQFEDGRTAKVTGEALSSLAHAWAMTVHKSQGSEYPCVILVCHHSLSWACQRCLLYTGVTRAKQRLVLVGSPKAVGMAVSNDKPTIRYTRLKRSLATECAARGIAQP